MNAAFYGVWKSGMIAGCTHTDTYGTPTASPASGQLQRYRASSVTRRPASSTCAGGEKNGMRSVWAGRSVLVRPQDTPSSRPALRGHAGLPGGGDSSRRLQDVRQGKAGNLGLACGQSVLHQTLRLLRGTALPDHDDQGRGRGNPAGLENDQGPRRAVHAGAVASSRHACAEGSRDRRDLDPQGAHLPHRGQRLGTTTADLVRGQGPAQKRVWTSSTSGWACQRARKYGWQ